MVTDWSQEFRREGDTSGPVGYLSGMDTQAATSENQQLQAELVEETQRLPGVREAIETFEKVAPYAGVTIEPFTTVTAFALGGEPARVTADAYLGRHPR